MICLQQCNYLLWIDCSVTVYVNTHVITHVLTTMHNHVITHLLTAMCTDLITHIQVFTNVYKYILSNYM